jgi:hypothetical protein
MSLAWRLDLLTTESHSHPNLHLEHQRSLEGWYKERKQQLDRSLASTIENGSYVCESNAWKIFCREWYLWVVQLVPGWKRWLEQGNRREGLTRYEWRDGENMAFLPSLGGGANLPQVYCVALGGVERHGDVRFTDDIIFDEAKKGLFRLVVFIDEILHLQQVQPLLDGIDEISGGVLRAAETTFIVKTTDIPPENVNIEYSDVYRLATASEFAASPLCIGRPEPRYYDSHRIWRESAGKQFIILRPDRFVFAACGNVDELREAAVKLTGLVSEGWLGRDV